MRARLRRLACRLAGRHQLRPEAYDGLGADWTWDGWPICRVCRAELR